MPHEIVWNKNHTKVKVWSTIVDGYLTNFMKPEELLRHPKFEGLVLWNIFKICPCCKQKLPPATEKGKHEIYRQR